jgi:hypothetical protein
MKKWMAGIAAAVLAGVLTWWLTEGLRPHPTPPAIYSVSGFWKYKMTSEVSGNTTRGSLSLTMDGSNVAGVLENTFDKTSTGVRGAFANNTLELTRETQMDDTTQFSRLTKQGGDKFTGTFWNRGRWKDNGTIEIER